MSFRDHHPLTPEQRADYLRDGLVRLPGFLPPGRLAAAQAVVFAALERGGFWGEGGWRLGAQKPEWP
ncbi:MAG TPA: hypothetical protein VFE13_13205, partial [Caulobacteraceae bacterium]|nr:hypothetical protein [Caulobacteraceae bacterium]